MNTIGLLIMVDWQNLAGGELYQAARSKDAKLTAQKFAELLQY